MDPPQPRSLSTSCNRSGRSTGAAKPGLPQWPRPIRCWQVAGLDNDTIRETLQSLHEQGTVRLEPDQAADDITGRLQVQEGAD
eukprot:3405777-Pyramimonas_sp.AAC.1